MESVPIQPVLLLAEIGSVGFLIVLVLAFVAFKFVGMRMLLGGIVALVVLIVGSKAVYHSLHFHPRQPVMIVHGEGWQGPHIHVPIAPHPPLAVNVDVTPSRVAAPPAPQVIEVSATAEVAEAAAESTGEEVTAKDDAKESTTDSSSDAKSSADEDRPDWVDAPPKRIDEIDRRVVSTGPWATFEECAAELDVQIMESVRDYMQTKLGADHVSRGMLPAMGITENYVRKSICTDQYVETTKHEFGLVDENMYTVHVLMEFYDRWRR